MEINHEKYAKLMIQYLVSRVLNDEIIEKACCYSDLAKEINYPEPYKGNLFGKNIGFTLGKVGDLLESVTIPEWKTAIPYIQALAVSKTEKIPSFGFRCFVPGYDSFSTNEKLNFVQAEQDKILAFGEHWIEVLEQLQVKPIKISKKSSKTKYYNPFGSEGSPEHILIKEYIKAYPHLLGYKGNKEAIDEYFLRSGDCVDVVFRDEDAVYAYEAKSCRSNEADLIRGILQCVKYKAVIEAETKLGNDTRKRIICSLVTQIDLPSKLKKYCEVLGVKHYKVDEEKLAKLKNSSSGN